MHTMKELETNRALPITSKTEGFVLIKKRRINESRIHSASCWSLHVTFHYSKVAERKLGGSKSKQRYYFSKSIDELKEKMKPEVNKDVGNLMHMCSQCRDNACI